MKAIEWSYVSYLAIAVPLTVYVARSLYHNGRVFLVDCFKGNDELADSVNRLLLVGFYLVNIGFVSLFLRSGEEIEGVRGVLELVSKKIGIVMLVLAVMHFFNLYIFTRLRKRPERRPVWGKSETPPPLNTPL